MPSSPESERDGAETLTESQRRGEERQQGRDLGAELAQAEDRHKRALADLDNYRKRTAREVDQRLAERGERITREWLEAVDSVERALRMEAPSNELAAGLRAVLEQMEAILERQGVERVGAPGERFDPELHDAVAVRESEEVPDRTILEVARSGYRAGARLLRPAQVVVSHRTDGDSPEQGDSHQGEVED